VHRRTLAPIPAVGARADRSFVICRTDIIRRPADLGTMNEERTLLSFPRIVRPEFVDLVREVSAPGSEGGNHWIDPALRIPQWGWLQDWAAYPGSNYIPHAFSLEFEHCHHPLLIEREWTVGCAPENHHGTVQYFVENVLPVIAEQID